MLKKVLMLGIVFTVAQIGIASQTWIGVSGGYYHDPAMWDDGVVPDQSSSQPCYLYNMNGTGPSLIVAGDNYNISTLNIGDWSNSTGLAWVKVTGGSISASWRVFVSYSDHLANQGAGGAVGRLDIDGGSVSGLTVIAGNNDAEVNISNGSLSGWWIGIGGQGGQVPSGSGMPGNGVVTITGGFMKATGSTTDCLAIYDGSTVYIGGDGQLIWAGNHVTDDPEANGDNAINDYIAAGKIQALDGYTLEAWFDNGQGGDWATHVRAVPVPEPITASLILFGLAGIVTRRK